MCIYTLWGHPSPPICISHRVNHPHVPLFVTFTSARTGSGGHFIFKYDRFMTVNEMWRLQGVPEWRIRKPDDVSERALRMMIGNGFSVNVLAKLWASLLPAAGLAPSPL